jgi:hypothetical protein
MKYFSVFLGSSEGYYLYTKCSIILKLKPPLIIKCNEVKFTVSIIFRRVNLKQIWLNSVLNFHNWINGTWKVILMLLSIWKWVSDPVLRITELQQRRFNNSQTKRLGCEGNWRNTTRHVISQIQELHSTRNNLKYYLHDWGKKC